MAKLKDMNKIIKLNARVISWRAPIQSPVMPLKLRYEIKIISRSGIIEHKKDMIIIGSMSGIVFKIKFSIKYGIKFDKDKDLR